MADISGFSEYTQSSLEILRQPQQTLHWYVIPIFLLVLYVVTKELSEKHYKILLGGLALWGVDLFNEIWNSMVCFISGYAPVWGAPVGVGDTAWLILIGYNVEISMMFLILGITACLMLPKDPKAKILGINNRVFLCIILTTLAVIIECFLNYCGILTWEWPFWQRSCPWLIWLIGYLPFLPRRSMSMTALPSRTPSRSWAGFWVSIWFCSLSAPLWVGFRGDYKPALCQGRHGADLIVNAS